VYALLRSDLNVKILIYGLKVVIKLIGSHWKVSCFDFLTHFGILHHFLRVDIIISKSDINLPTFEYKVVAVINCIKGSKCN